MPDAQRMPIVERLRESANAFRKHPVYNSDGDGILLTVQADECDNAADAITSLLEAAKFARSYFANIPANDRLSEQQKALNLLADAINLVRKGGEA